MSTALLFPGQGTPGRATPVSTTDTQVALLTTGVAAARTLIDEHGLRVDAVAGHSAGVFGAAVVAGVLDLPAALRVVRVRGAAMERACASGSWAMAAVRGLDRAAVQRLVDTTYGPLWIANVNAADQIVVAGTRAALDALRRRAPAAGARDVIDLGVAVASHGPLQAGTAREVARALAGEAHGEQRRAYFANTTGRRLLHAPGAVLDDVALSVQQPVRWHDIVRLMPELGITTTVQVPPGHALAALAARAHPHLTDLAVDDLGIPATVHRLKREE
ncbi:ACP S-malonyltransferase [Dactylosporangium siamense]|uniref:[acyl-carrier-protein] S-malonyltransferase n=1 Tax=Dactylosporangium siamense TaxID=685454 RepID=A0A919UB44_9ACTN|nr:acyltransferase domain-containing protein [Dactylosporangium siamense]GIG45310.1 malonate decarboxylase subunit epsilon [Dactylosporangium siamense]